jgi:hypothetical protein
MRERLAGLATMEVKLVEDAAGVQEALRGKYR